jgi:uncharacterized membrane protein YuzA (DUF378 family)
MKVVCKVAKLVVALYAINAGLSAVCDTDLVEKYMPNATYAVGVVVGICGVLVLAGLVHCVMSANHQDHCQAPR